MLGKRTKPRRNEGRIKHKRIKPKAAEPATAEEQRHLDRVAAMPCCVCGAMPVCVHHVRASIHGGILPRRHKLVTPLCPTHHYAGNPHAVHEIGHDLFYQYHGIDLLKLATQLWMVTAAMEAGASKDRSAGILGAVASI